MSETQMTSTIIHLLHDGVKSSFRNVKAAWETGQIPLCTQWLL
jgi:hypothetical protein